MPIFTRNLHIPIGDMMAGATDAGLVVFDFRYRKSMPAILRRLSGLLQQDFQEGNHPLLDRLEAQLNEYFAGTRQTFDLPLLPLGSDFQLRVWQSLMDIPYGHTRSYLQQARSLGDEKAVRALASANGANALAILIPCHRVVGADGSLTGYGGGLPAKRWLLRHEQKYAGLACQSSLF